MTFEELSTTVKIVFSPNFVMLTLAEEMPDKYLGKWICTDYDKIRLNLWKPMSIDAARGFIKANNLKLVGGVR